ncbi:peptide ABC transporter peptide-binding protein [Enterococcus sp. 7E2_DIV0204]|uniref:Peptide ABC transporter peptide-binding protein n=1 Tax=Candidatus Enterococcus lemimoniae TaxID=1834167 RepID=A0ABZ2T8N8_9ENTE|nr:MULTISPECIES: peptide ABC transporter substrate-binding protein [unclassified Enterococcus]OTN88180.1 peptide ABC transporter peptide-binding protein [Enterococcus sp. 7E2_DIV0204]OTO70352.1 peptide ABC transporter peptide-binding protein [Enterococcus sp. 12C11_DIV0727]OTP49141.1 peptide ABC transporter peptide-binding protein [Enterococcus sp. 7D2_DIV0200]
MKLKKSFAFGFITLFSLTLAACGNGGGNTDDSGSSKEADGKASGEQIFRINEQQEMPSADPSLATDEVSFTALNNVYEGIYRLDAKNKPQPAGAAEKAEMSEDGLVYKIKLNEDAKWSDGKPVKAEDYVYGWQRTVDPATASEYASLYSAVKNGQEIMDGKKDKSELGIKAVGDYELEVTLQQVTPFMDYLFAFPSFFPQRQDVVEKYGAKFAANSENAVYNGPFTLADFDGPGTDTEWSLKKNKEYWDNKTVKLDEVKVSVVKEAPTSLNLFQDGQVDEVVLSGELAQQMASDPEFVIEKEASTQYMELNQREDNSPFKNENLRKAISYSIDRKSLVESILGDGSVEPKGLVPADMSTSPKGDKDFADEAGDEIAHDEKKAKEYWEKAKKELGITKLDMDILSSDTDSSKKTVEYLQGAIQDTLDGVKVTVSPVPFAVRLDRSNKGDFTTVIGGWGADYADPSSFLNLFETGNSYNRGHYSSPEYDKNVKAAATTNANDPEKRWDNMIDAEKVIMDDMGVVPLYQRAQARMRSEKVKGIAFHPAGPKFDYKWAYISE